MRNTSPARYFLGLAAKALVIAGLPFSGQRADAAITVGGLVVVGYKDNGYDLGSGTSDEIAFLATETIAAGQEVYITNNGWINQSSDYSFNGKDNTGINGSGPENLMKLTITSSIAAGTVVKTSDVTNSAFTWTTSGRIPTGNIASALNFSMLDLKHGSIGLLGYGDQVYIFQADGVDPFYTGGTTVYGAGINPLAHPTSFIHALNMGDNTLSPTGFDNGYVGGNGGAVPDGIVGVEDSSNTYNAPHALQVGNSDDGDPDNDYSAFQLNAAHNLFNGTFGINMSSSAISALQSSGGSKDTWLALLSNSNNWSSRTDLSFSNFNFTVVPEPSRMLLLLGGGVPLLLRRQRRAP